MLRFLLGLIIGIVLVPLAVMGWFKVGHPPVAVADKPLPFERNIVSVPMHARIDSELVKTPPIQADEAAFVAGAKIYRDDCSECHGFHSMPSGRDLLEGSQWHPSFRHALLQQNSYRHPDVAGNPAAGQC